MQNHDISKREIIIGNLLFKGKNELMNWSGSSTVKSDLNKKNVRKRLKS